jgi:S-adenosylmethionine decarboxylase
MVQRPAIQEAATPWGILTSIDSYGCNPETIRDADAIKRFVAELCKRIGMKRFGECQVVHFGQDERVAGYSMIQLIETSLISGHFANRSNAAYIDVFSCKPYDPDEVAEFTRKFFEAEFIEVHVAKRM